MDKPQQGAGASNNSHVDTGEAEQSGQHENKQSRDGLHDPSYQKGGAQGAEAGDGLNADTGTGTDETPDIGRGAD